MHWENVPASILATLLGLAFVVFAMAAWSKADRARRRRRGEARRRRNLAHRRAWDWLMGRNRHRRLTHQPMSDQRMESSAIAADCPSRSST